MNMIRVVRKIGIVIFVLLLFFSTASADEILKINNDSFTLYDFEKINDVEGYHFYGQYKGHWNLLQGESYHLFPNNKFIIESWCDVCVTRVIASGNFEFSKSKILLKYDAENNKYPKKLIIKYGDSETDIGTFLFTEDQYLKTKTEKDYPNFMKLITPYHNWEGIYKKKSSNKYLNPTPESIAALRGKFYGGAGLEKR